MAVLTGQIKPYKKFTKDFADEAARELNKSKIQATIFVQLLKWKQRKDKVGQRACH